MPQYTFLDIEPSTFWSVIKFLMKVFFLFKKRFYTYKVFKQKAFFVIIIKKLNSYDFIGTCLDLFETLCNLNIPFTVIFQACYSAFDTVKAFYLHAISLEI